MNNYISTYILMMIYILGLLALAYFFEKKGSKSIQLLNTPIVYSLSLAVYCTSWTYYGAVGSAVKNGGLYMTLYLGPMLSLILWKIIVSRFIDLKIKFNFTSMIDLLTTRYDKSIGLGILCSLFILIGVAPYMSLQIKAIVETVNIISNHNSNVSFEKYNDLTALSVIFTLIMSTMYLGLRNIRTSEQHPGVTLVLAIEGFIKIIAFVTVGFFALYIFNDGFDNLIDHLPTFVDSNYSFMGHRGVEDVFVWFTYLLLSTSAFIFLPRQFHVSVIENYNKKHITAAGWIFPLYLLAICFFVLPLAIAGLKAGLPKESADSFVLLLPLLKKYTALAYFVFIGGISAAAGMLLISGMTISTILANNLFIPLINNIKILKNIPRKILTIRFIALTSLYFISYSFWKTFGNHKALMALGMISFAAVFQFVPVIIGGLFWKKSSKTGAFFGLSLGIILWFYTLIIPLFIKSEIVSSSILETGLFGLQYLKPEALFNFTFFHPLTHATFWSILFNILGFVIGSLLFPQTTSEKRISEDFFNITTEKDQWDYTEKLKENILLDNKISILKKILLSYFSKKKVEKIIQICLEKTRLQGKSKISVLKLSELNTKVEKQIASSIGTAAANLALQQEKFITEEENNELMTYYSNYLSKMKISPAKLNKSIALFKEKEKMMKHEAKLLEEVIKNKTKEIEFQKSKSFNASKLAALGEMAGGIAHEINNPLAVISGYVNIITRMLELNELDHDAIKSSLVNIKDTVVRISKIVNSMRNISRDSSNEEFQICTLNDALEDAISLCREKLKNNGINLTVEIDNSLGTKPIRLKRLNISQCFINLLNNSFDAVKENDEKWIKIIVTQNIEKIEILFSDSGSGIPDDIKENVFNPFFTTKDIGQGTGLGLSLVRKTIQEHNGDIVIDTQNANTTFLITIPIAT